MQQTLYNLHLYDTHPLIELAGTPLQMFIRVLYSFRMSVNLFCWCSFCSHNNKSLKLQLAPNFQSNILVGISVKNHVR